MKACGLFDKGSLYKIFLHVCFVLKLDDINIFIYFEKFKEILKTKHTCTHHPEIKGVSFVTYALYFLK